MRDVVILSSPAPEFLAPARRLSRGLRAAGRRVTLRMTDTGARYAFFRQLSRTGAALFVYLGHGTSAGWSAWGTTGPGYLNALSWTKPVDHLINLTCEGDWARTQVRSNWIRNVWASPERVPFHLIESIVDGLIECGGRLTPGAAIFAPCRRANFEPP